ncbi:MAG: Holliday junction resolvase RuvX [Candidatus Daviesbacteria bacterium]|nr:MAG: Holliday junction resolvase RuvX [Candidatus Daviesbacteria bacterium]
MKYLGVDFGMKRAGLAVSQGQLATPWKTVEGKGWLDLAEKISQIVSEENFEKIVVGLPEGQMGKKVQKFINLLLKKSLDVVSADETLTSKGAFKLMITTGKGKEKRKSDDAVAAALILQNYLDELTG